MAKHLDDLEIFPWNRNFITGIPQIDEQHHKLADLINELTRQLAKDDLVVLSSVFDELQAYASYHFQTEESIWAPCFEGDPWFATHQKTHSSFLEMIFKIKNEQNGQSLREVVTKIVKFLISWLAFHVLDSDKRMAIVLQNVNAGVPLEEAKLISDVEMNGSTKVLVDTILSMYEDLSSRTLVLMRERVERQKIEIQLTELARHDVLTGLANRAHFEESLREGLIQADRNEQSLAVLLLDLDHFKNVNDIYGHPAGDALLVEAALRLTECARETDTVARLGGDEFAIIATNLKKAEGAGTLAQKVIDTISKPFNLDGQVVNSGTSVGIAIYPSDLRDPDKLLTNADMALYKAKEDCRGTFHFHDRDMNAAALARKALEMELVCALDNQELELFFQPVVNPNSTAIIGTEALVRWNHPEKGLILPGDFIATAESTGLIVRIGERVISLVCEQIAAWYNSGLPEVPVSINISLLQLQTGKLAEFVIKTLGKTGANPACLEFEFSEGIVTERLDRVVPELNRLREIGISLVIDNFGIGNSSLTALAQLPFSKVKIDRMIPMDSIGPDTTDQKVAGAMIELGKAFGMDVIAKGIETEDQLAVAAQERCDGVQGFHICGPQPSDVFVEWWMNFDNSQTQKNRRAL